MLVKNVAYGIDSYAVVHRSTPNPLALFFFAEFMNVRDTRGRMEFFYPLPAQQGIVSLCRLPRLRLGGGRIAQAQAGGRALLQRGFVNPLHALDRGSNVCR